MGAHAVLSPSSAARWMACPGSVAMSEGLSDQESPAAFEGTVAHGVAERCLKGDLRAETFIGHAETSKLGVTVTVDESMAADIQIYLDYCNAIVEAHPGVALIEAKLPLYSLTGEAAEGDGPPVTGTADFVYLRNDGVVHIVDLKFGRGVEVSAVDNPQLRIYALAALDEFHVLYDMQHFELAIVQPRITRQPSTESLPLFDLLQFGERVRAAAKATTEPKAPRVPGEKQCRWCRAKAICPELRSEVAMHVSAAPGTPDDFDDLTDSSTLSDADLARSLGAVPLVEVWCKAVRAEAEARLLAGKALPGFKLVQGKRGPRKWADDTAAEQMLKGFRLKTEEMYDLKLISPTSAEKLLKVERLGPRQFKKLESLITQSAGGYSVAPASDTRPAITPSASADDFDDLTTQPTQE